MTMHRDLLGNPVSTDTDAALAGVNDFVEGILAYETRAVRVLAAADADPTACLTNAYAAVLHLLIESPQGPATAEPYLRRAEAAAPGATEREEVFTAFVRAWCGDEIPEAMRLGLRLIRKDPRDLLTVKLLHYHAFNAGRFAEMLRIVELTASANADVAWMHGMAAFAYEQCHLLDEAEAAARRALALRRKEPWAQHALAHVMLTRGRIEEGAAFLEGVRDTWVDLNSFMETHLWWHLALFRLSQGRMAEVLEIYDRHCWGVAKDYSQDQAGAVSLLARLEVSGVDVGDRWAELGAYLAARGLDVVQPFLALQYLYGLGRAGRPEADALMAAIAGRAAKAPD
ncbi:MAG: tetratricopeptide repeat protein, partial [Caulobacteraceae bacterium]